MDKERLKSLYFYAVSFVCLMLIIGGLISFFFNLTDLMLPPVSTPPPSLVGEPPEINGRKITEEEWRKQQEEQHKWEQEQERRRNMRGMIYGAIVVGVATPLYVYHWRRARQG
ncbi:MAG: hypothetical protein PWQ91_1054 [Eubacteriales bacterium]|nr:hypothetical protein [Eubacteriales bacterium]